MFLFLVFNGNLLQSQIVTVKIEDFVNQHSGFEENEEGEINPINLKEINKRIFTSIVLIAIFLCSILVKEIFFICLVLMVGLVYPYYFKSEKLDISGLSKNFYEYSIELINGERKVVPIFYNDQKIYPSSLTLHQKQYHIFYF